MSEQLGSAADEAARLLAAVEAWARGKAALLRDGEHLATGSPACTLCPVCQAIGAVRQLRPEAVEHVLDAATSLVMALRSAFPNPAPPAADPGPPPADIERIPVAEG